MGLFKSKYERELDQLIARIDMNMSNNYKDNAQADFREFEAALKRFTEEGLIKGKACTFYEGRLTAYRSKLSGYTHKDQKPCW